MPSHLVRKMGGLIKYDETKKILYIPIVYHHGYVTN